MDQTRDHLECVFSYSSRLFSSRVWATNIFIELIADARLFLPKPTRPCENYRVTSIKTKLTYFLRGFIAIDYRNTNVAIVVILTQHVIFS